MQEKIEAVPKVGTAPITRRSEMYYLMGYPLPHLCDGIFDCCLASVQCFFYSLCT